MLTGLAPQPLTANTPDVGADHMILSMRFPTPQPFVEIGLAGDAIALDATAFYGLKIDVSILNNFVS